MARENVDAEPLVIVGQNLDAMAEAVGVASGPALYSLLWHNTLDSETKRRVRAYLAEHSPFSDPGCGGIGTTGRDEQR